LKASVNSLVLSCEHASNGIPARYRRLFRDYRALLDSHRGWDPGAGACARCVAGKTGAPLIRGTVSRLLIDCNRSLWHPRIFSEISATLPAADRRFIIDTYYRPYRERLRQAINRSITRHGQALHISIHSFTPELGGVIRDADVGVLYDPRRASEKKIAVVLQRRLQALAPGLKIRRNYPYRGRADGATRQYRNEFPGRSYAGLEIEINQKLPLGADRSGWRQLQHAIAVALTGL
jgi:predicted N-formylglutamate amidohydrolase